MPSSHWLEVLRVSPAETWLTVYRRRLVDENLAPPIKWFGREPKLMYRGCQNHGFGTAYIRVDGEMMKNISRGNYEILVGKYYSTERLYNNTYFDNFCGILVINVGLSCLRHKFIK